MKKLIDNKGISLIALMVTIIVLIILAAISLATLTGNNGTIDKAGEASDKTKYADLREDINLVLSNHETSSNSLEQDLKNKFGNDAVRSVSNIENMYYITKDGYTMTVYDTGDIFEGEINVWDGSSKSKPSITQSGDWHIYTTDELHFFEMFVNKTLTDSEKQGIPEITTDTKVYLENDLDMGARKVDGSWDTEANTSVQWTPIGKEKDNKFVGTFYGQNHTISGIYVNDTVKYSGLFGNCNGIEDLTIKNSCIKCSDWICRRTCRSCKKWKNL